MIIGGTIGWPDGPEIPELEVWSPHPECDIKIKEPPITFPDYPAVAFFGENLYVCGGQSSGRSLLGVKEFLSRMDHMILEMSLTLND